jgi:hypothetical protein
MFSKYLSVSVVLVLVGVVAGRPQDPEVTITRSEFENKEDGSFSWASELSDGSKQEQSGQLKQIGEEQGIVIQGSYSYISPDGTPIQVKYIADENGFQPTGDHLPTSPPIPEVTLVN